MQQMVLQIPVLNQENFSNYVLSNSKVCVFCKAKDGVKKFNITVFHRFKIKCCSGCMNKFGGKDNTVLWIELNLNYPIELSAYYQTIGKSFL